MMGNEFLESPVAIKNCEVKGIPPMGIGTNCRIDNAIIDKNARIGNNVTLSPSGSAAPTEGDGYVIRDGIIIVLKGAVIPDGTTITSG